MSTAQPQTTEVILRTLASDDWTKKFSSTLPEGVSAQRFASAAITAVRNFKEAGEVDRASLYNAVIQAAQAGLLPDGRQGALVSFNVKNPDGSYGKQARFMKMVEGVIDQLAAAGITAYAVSVYKNDEIRVWNDDEGQHVEHNPVVFGDRGARIGALAVAKYAGVSYVETMTREDLDKARAASRSKDKQGNPTGPWLTWPDRMEQKSVLHRLAKRLPKMGARIEDDEIEDVPAGPVIDVVSAAQPAQGNGAKPAAEQKRPRGLQAVMEAQPELEAEPAQDVDGVEEAF